MMKTIKNVKKEFIYTAVARRPYIRSGGSADLLLRALKEFHIRGSGSSPRGTALMTDSRYLDTIGKCQWYQGIHGWRYYLLWHKDSFRNTHRSAAGGTSLPDTIKATIDFNVIEWRTRKKLDSPGIQFLRLQSATGNIFERGVKERKHIDDMFF